MAARSIANELVRFFHALTAPVCLFDEDRRLVFANQACADWAATSLDELIGRTASYTSATKEGEAAAIDRLCPPPDAFAGRRVSGAIHAVAGDGTLRSRRADFQPLDGGRAGGVLVLADAAETAVEMPAALDADHPRAGASDNAPLLHERLLRFQHEQRSRYRLGRLVGDSPAMQLVRSQARAAIASGASAIVVGASGSGREELARTIHYATIDLARTQRAEQQIQTLLPLDGSLLTSDMLASAVAALSAQGRAPAATILILHLDRLPLDIQAEVVRALVQRFAGLRFLATSELAPDVLASQGRLHPLLAAATGTVVIRLPSLAERREDIPIVAQYSVEELNAEGKKQVRGFSAESLDALVAYSWPGNLAELRGMVAEAFARVEGVEITVADLPQRLTHAAGMARRPVRTDEPIVLADFLTDIERELIARAIAHAKGNKARAARLLGLTRPRLYRRMVQLGLAADVPRPARSATPPRRAAEGDSRRRIPGGFQHGERMPKPVDLADGNRRDAAADEAEFIENIPFEEQPE